MQEDEKVKLSVIVPVYNVEQYLKKCIDSILSQTFKNLELIIVDDGSTDSSPEICDTYKGNDSVIVTHQKNCGLSDARNAGIRLAKGEYVAFVDSDDWIDSGMYKEMVDVAKKTDSDIVVCGHRVVKSSGEVEDVVTFGEDVVMNNVDATKSILKDEKMPSFAWNKIIRKKLFNGIEFPQGRLYEDTATIYKCFSIANKVAVVNHAFYNYLRRSGSICLNTELSVRESFKRGMDNALAFFERYLFAKENKEFSDMISICKVKAFSLSRSALNYAIRNNIPYKDLQVQELFTRLYYLDSVSELPISNASKIEYVLLRFNPRFCFFIMKLFYMIK